MPSVATMFPRRLARVVLITCLMVTIAIVYVTVFQHPPPDEVIKKNGGSRGSPSFSLRGFASFQNHDKSDHFNKAQEIKRRENELENDELNENEKEAAGEEEKEEEKEEEDDDNIFDRLDDGDDDNDKDEDEDANLADKEDEEEEEKPKLSKTVMHIPKGENGKLQRRRSPEQKTILLKKTGREQLKTEHTRTGEVKKERVDKEEEVEEERKKTEMKKKEERKKTEGNKSSQTKKSGGGGGGELIGKAAWEKFIAANHHTVIGIVFDRCENPVEQLGTVVMLPDLKNGGVMSRTFYNFTLDKEISEGWVFKVEVQYNGQDLYDNWWEVCEMEEDLDPQDRTFQCPIKPGPLSLIKDKHVPGYIPKGRYQTKAWVEDSNHTVLVCGYSDFVL